MKITAKPGLDKVLAIENIFISLHFQFIFMKSSPSTKKAFVWKNKAGVEWELTLTKVEKNGGVLVFKVGKYFEP